MRIRTAATNTLYFFPEFFNNIIQPFVPIEVQTISVATARMLNALCALPYLTAARTAGACRKSIPYHPAAALPVRLPIGLPLAAGATDMDIV